MARQERIYFKISFFGFGGVARDDGVLGIEGETLVARLAEGVVKMLKS